MAAETTTTTTAAAAATARGRSDGSREAHAKVGAPVHADHERAVVGARLGGS